MKTLVLSDTHVASNRVATIFELIRPYLNVDHIFHAGDVVCPELLHALRSVASVSAVAGNMDPPSVQSFCEDQSVVELLGHRIGLIHGWGTSQDLVRKVFERFTDKNNQPTVEAIIFGHSHQAQISAYRDVLMLNPGSPTDRRNAPHCSVMSLEIDELGLRPKIIHLRP